MTSGERQDFIGGLRAAALSVLATLFLAAAPVHAALVDFESVLPGTVYGHGTGHVAGETVLMQDGIAMSLDVLHVGSFVGFNNATVGGAFASRFATTPLELNNISVAFDFTDLGFSVDRISLEVQHFGGTSNFSVNGASLRDLLMLDDVSQSVAPGVVAHLANDLLTIEGSIDGFRIGGQELAIDNVLAVPEPTTALLTLLALGWTARRTRQTRPH